MALQNWKINEQKVYILYISLYIFTAAAVAAFPEKCVSVQKMSRKNCLPKMSPLKKVPLPPTKSVSPKKSVFPEKWVSSENSVFT